MKPLSIGFSRFLARSLSIAVIGSLLASWTPLGISMAQDASEESPALDASLERLWNQSLDDPSPQVRGVPGAPPAQRVNPPKAQPSPPKPAALPVSQPTSKAASQEKPIQNAIPNSASPKPKKDTLETPPERSGVALPLAMPLAPLNESKVQPKFGKKAKPRSQERIKKTEPVVPAEPKPKPPQATEMKGLLNSPEQSKSEQKPATPAKDEPGKAQEAQRLAQAYVTLLTQWQQAKGRQNLEPILNKGQEAASALLKVADVLNDDEFKSIGKQLPGYLLIRNDILVIGPDPNFFVTLATQKGKPVDMAFFQLMSETLNGYWPSTMEQLEDLSGCTRFGTGQLVALYGGWTQFKRQYPKAYLQALNDPNLLLIKDIEDQLLNSASACEGPESVIEELEKFVITYPRSPLTPPLKLRLEALRQKKADMSFNQGVRHLLNQP